MSTEESPKRGVEKGNLRKYWDTLSDVYNARIAAAVFLAVLVAATLIALFIAEARRGEADPSANEGRNQFLSAIGIPAAIYFAATARVTGKKRSRVRYNALAPASFVLLIVACVVMWTWVFLFCFVLEETIVIQVDATHTQEQVAPYPIGKGIALICKYFAPYVTYLLALDVWAATTK